MRAYLRGSFYNAFLPTGIGGDAMRIAVLRHDIGLKDSTRSVVIDRASGLAAICLAAGACLPFTDYLDDVPALRAAIAALSLTASIVLVIVLARRGLAGFVGWTLLFMAIWFGGIWVLARALDIELDGGGAPDRHADRRGRDRAADLDRRDGTREAGFVVALAPLGVGTGPGRCAGDLVRRGARAGGARGRSAAGRPRSRRGLGLTYSGLMPAQDVSQAEQGSVAVDEAVRGVGGVTAISVIMPAYNEAANLAVVVPRTLDVLAEIPGHHEVIIVDDGSHDGTAELMGELQKQRPGVRYLRLRRNYGKSTALQAGLRARTRPTSIVLMDADGQDQPESIPRCWPRSTAGSTSRRAGASSATTASSSAPPRGSTTASPRRSPGVEGQDFNSGLKAMRRDVMTPLVLYGELHRYIPMLANWAGFQVGEVDVEHKPRLHGESKFGRARFYRGFLDLLTVKFITTYTGRPFHLFGGSGSSSAWSGPRSSRGC